MKRTTYILIGVLFANIVLGIAILTYIRVNVSSSDDKAYKVNFSGKVNSTDFNDIHTLEFRMPASHTKNNFVKNPYTVTITPSEVDNSTKVFCPDQIKLELDKERNGVLKIILDIDPDSIKKAKRISLDKLQLRVEGGKTLKRIVADWSFDIVLDQMMLGELTLITPHTKLDSCIVDSLSIDADRIRCKNSTFKSLRLEKLKKVNLGNSQIELLHIIGSNNRNYDVPSGRINKILWEPKNKQAKLNLRLKDKAEIILGN